MDRENAQTAKQRRTLIEHQIAQNEVKSGYEQQRRNVYYFMERPSSKIAITYHIMNLLFIVVSMVVSILSTISEYETDPFMRKFILYYELFLLSWFSIEYVLRVWSCSFLSKYKGLRGKLRFMKTFYMMVDAFVIISTLTTALLQIKTAYFTILRVTRFLQIFRILRLDRQRGDLRTMALVVNKHRKELVTCYFVGFIILFGGTYVVYLCEKLSAEEPTIDNMANGLYWAMITVTSVGYGDMSPNSWAGKMITGVFALIGCAFFALPAGILGSGFALQVAKQKKQKRYIKVRNPAAILIQTCWRNYVLTRSDYRYQASWFHFFPYIHKNKQGYYDLEEASSKHQKVPLSNGLTLNELFKTEQLIVEIPQVRTRKKSSISRKKSSYESPPLSKLLHRKYKCSIVFILRVKFWKAVKIFKSTRYPFVNVQDIMEKNASCHTETLTHLRKINENLIEFKLELEAMKVEFRSIMNQNPSVPSTITNPNSSTFINQNSPEANETEILNENPIVSSITSNENVSECNDPSNDPILNIQDEDDLLSNNANNNATSVTFVNPL